ncbi:GNAT family N-acetyltransferase [Candidatus Bipolaricaulota sp. J31]
MIFRRGRPEDLEGIVCLLKACFGTYRRWELDEGRYRAWVESDPGFGWEGVFVAEEDGEIVGHLNVLFRELSLSGNWMGVAGIANMAVHPSRRRQGVARGLLSHVLARVHAPLAALFAGFGEAAYALYRAQGFSAFAFTRYAVVTWEMLRKQGSGTSVRRASEDDSPLLQRLYERYACTWDGTVKRNEAFFRERVFRSCAFHTFFRSRFGAEVFLAEPERGYAVVWPREEDVPLGMVVVGEMVWEDEDAGIALLSAIAEQMGASGLRVFAPSLPSRIEAEWFTCPEVLMLKPLDPSWRRKSPDSLSQGRGYIFPADRW